MLQEELDKIGKAGAYGLWTASVGTMPISGTAGAVISVTGLSQSFNNLLKNEPPARIRNVNETKLQQMGVAPDLAKRYLDAEELLQNGIDVYTTVNIQHIDSLNDVVAQITRDSFPRPFQARRVGTARSPLLASPGPARSSRLSPPR